MLNQVSPTRIPLTVVKESCPGGTYFRTSDVTPFVDDDGLHIYNGTGVSRSWGRSQVSSEVAMLTDDIIKVEVVGWHKHTVSPVGGSYYFVRDGKGNWTRRTANYGKVKAALN